MQGGRANVGRMSVNLNGRQATKLSAGGQPQPVVHRPKPASAGPRRTGSASSPTSTAPAWSRLARLPAHHPSPCSALSRRHRRSAKSTQASDRERDANSGTD